ncbi:hypothetical protein K353_00623 [Kitasatospora sp. SolWspMP-SS2h]|nr:hypothetical protein [Kitasatospora sp. SolWspMP-SS2h]RAJ46246.1 hypothetical protein K353_00623 [Kitasatospora sp. SolWspMP-SS2h]
MRNDGGRVLRWAGHPRTCQPRYHAWIAGAIASGVEAAVQLTAG